MQVNEAYIQKPTVSPARDFFSFAERSFCHEATQSASDQTLSGIFFSFDVFYDVLVFDVGTIFILHIILL